MTLSDCGCGLLTRRGNGRGIVLWGALELAKCPDCPCSTACLPGCLVAAWLMAMLSGWAIQIKINDALTTSGDGGQWATRADTETLSHREREKKKERERTREADRTATRGSHKNYFTCGQHVTTTVKLSHLARTTRRCHHIARQPPNLMLKRHQQHSQLPFSNPPSLLCLPPCGHSVGLFILVFEIMLHTLRRRSLNVAPTHTQAYLEGKGGGGGGSTARATQRYTVSG